MPAVLTLFEHEAQAFEWLPDHLAALERMNRAAGTEILRATVRGRQRVLLARQHVGVVRLGGRTVQVLPKIYRDVAYKPQEQAREATRNLLYMLAYAGDLPVREHEIAPLLRHDPDWFEILTHLFATHLLAEWQRGAHRGYQLVEDESPALKGKWRIAEQLRRPERKHIFPVAYDEFSADNALNRVFRFVVERLWHLTRDAENRQRLGELQQWLDEVTLLPSMHVGDADPARLITRLNERYAPLLTLARLFLDGGALQVTAGETNTFAFVFDMNALFESFLVAFIHRHRDAILPPTLQRCELLPQASGARRWMALRAGDGTQVFPLKPDLAFRDGARFPLLLDAKYKLLDAESRRLGVAPDDFYQMFAYAHRYNCPRVVVVYPQTAGMPEPLHACYVVEDAGRQIAVTTVDLRLDLQHERAMLIQCLKMLLQGEGWND